MSTTRIPLVDLKAQYHGIQDEIDSAIRRVLENTNFILGKEVADFERDFAAYCGVKNAVGVASGTAALMLALDVAGVGPGDEVITTPLTFFATAEAISRLGARPVFADIDPRTFDIEPELVEEACTPRTKAIVPVHLYGMPAEMGALSDIAMRRGLWLIEDAAQAHGAFYRDERAGSMGDMAAFSFYPGKNLGAYGDGGAVTTNDDGLANVLRQIRNHGRKEKYVHEMIGFGERLDAIQAAVLSVKLRHLDDWVLRRRKLAARYRELLKDAGVGFQDEMVHIRSSYHLFVIRVPERDRVLRMLHDRGIGAGVHYPVPLHLQPAYRHLGYKPGDFPEAERAAAEVLSLPIYPEMTDEQQDRVVEALLEALAEVRNE